MPVNGLAEVPSSSRKPVHDVELTLISLVAGECRVGTEVAVTNQPKVLGLRGD
jgi:hypothetical protein